MMRAPYSLATARLVCAVKIHYDDFICPKDRFQTRREFICLISTHDADRDAIRRVQCGHL